MNNSLAYLYWKAMLILINHHGSKRKVRLVKYFDMIVAFFVMAFVNVSGRCWQMVVH